MWVLSILQQSPRNGAEIMDQIEMASQGWWRPSPGSVYPLLDALLQEGSVKKGEDGRYEITEKGKEEFSWPMGMQPRQPVTVEGIISEMGSYISYLEDLKRSNPSKLSQHSDQLQGLKNRLAALVQ